MEKVRGFEKIVPDSDVKLPVRKTAGSAGYDFYAPYDIEIPAKSSSKIIFTGVKAYMQKNEYLACHIRSGLAYKRGLMLVNAVGVIDSDYYNNPDNGGDIGIMFYNASNNSCVIKAGERIMQGIFTPYFIADNDNASGERTGGFGSTGTR